MGDELISAAVPLVFGVGVGLLLGITPLELLVALASIALISLSVPRTGMDGLLVGVAASLLIAYMITAAGLALGVAAAAVSVLLSQTMLGNRAVKLALAAALVPIAILSTRLIMGISDMVFMVSMVASIYVSAMLAWKSGGGGTARSGNYVMASSLALFALAMVLTALGRLNPAAAVASSVPAAASVTRSRLIALRAGVPLAAIVAAAFLGVAPYMLLTQSLSVFGVRKEHYHKGLEPPLAWLHAWLNGRYFIDSIVAAGGFSYVLKGFDEKGTAYAVKVLKEKDARGNPLASNPNIIQSFKREMSNYLLIDSPRIVKVYEVHIPPDEELPYKDLVQYLRDPPYIVMEYMRGGSLRQYLKEKGRLDVGDALRVAREIALALEELHMSGRLHLDLKPENILFGDEERKIVKIGDLGASKIATGGYLLVSQFSASYAAPEVLRGRQATDRSDVYSLGLVMYEMLTGINPQAYRLNNMPPPAVDLQSLGVPPSVEILINRCMDPNPLRRPTIMEVANALGA